MSAIAVAAGLYAKVPSAGAPVQGTSPGALTYPRVPGPPPDAATLLGLLGVGSLGWFAAAAVFPVLMWGARTVETRGRGLRVALIAAASVTIPWLVTGVTHYLMVYRGAPVRPGFAAFLPVMLRESLAPWVALVALVVALESRRRSGAAALEAERMRAELLEQRLNALVGQLQPHFVFNTLQGISTLIHRDADAADEMLAKLSDLLRELLRPRERALVTFEEELRYTRTYLEIAALRFADRLQFDLDVPETLLAAGIPLFLLQPLVENALSHGIGPTAEGGRVSIIARRNNAQLEIDVFDNGAGLDTERMRSDGVGLSNTRNRLQATYGDSQHLAIERAAGGGTRVRVSIPFEAVAEVGLPA
ncbi:MAG: histidine kinase [Gemmatimonadota bacterium]